jgi:hypothetical protein
MIDMSVPSTIFTRRLKAETYRLLQLYRALENGRTAMAICRACSDDLPLALGHVKAYINRSLEDVSMSTEGVAARRHLDAKLEELSREVQQCCEQKRPLPRGIVPKTLKVHTRMFRLLLSEGVRVPLIGEAAAPVSFARLVIEDCG